MQLESLESRNLLAATDLASITGRVYDDQTGDGYTAGEEVAGAQVELFVDDGDGVFEPGTDDSLATSDTTDLSGLYRFDDLSAGGYFVRQPAQTVGALTLNESSSDLITISTTAAAGTPGTPIDTFDTTAQIASAMSTGGNNPDFNAVNTAPGEALGGERDLFAELISGTGMITLEVGAFGLPVLQFDSTAGVSGTRIATWDGDDNDGQTLDATGLGGIDLTEAGANTHFELTTGADQADGTIIITIYTDATNFSTASAPIPVTGGAATGEVQLPFASFAAGGGAAGPANLADVGAITLEIGGTALSVNGRIDLFGTVGPTLFTQDFANFESADLSVTKSVDNATPSVGEQVVFTVTVANGGPDAASGVVVSDPLPGGLSFVSATASQGSYDDSNGEWAVGDLAAGANATLDLTTTVDSVGTKANTAEVTAATPFDPDSTPDNGNAQEDDQASATVTPLAADLSLTKTVDNATPSFGEDVTFTITVDNAGPNTATGIEVSDPLPAGLTFVSSTASQGSYVADTGQWTVGTLASDAAATLDVLATFNGSGPLTNVAEVSAVDQLDPDSTPGNGSVDEDDRASVALTPSVLCTGTVFEDGDNNGQQDSGEVGITGVTVALSGTDADGFAVNRSTTTDAAGHFEFAEVPPSNASGYTLTETQPASYLDGSEQAGSAGGVVATPSSLDRISQIVVASGDVASGYTFAELVPSSFSGRVYYDANNDGVRQSNEPGIAHVVLALAGTDDLGAAVATTTTTDASGIYTFGNLRPGDYAVTETQPSGFLDGQETLGTPINATAADNVFSNIGMGAGVTAVNYNFGELARILSIRRFLASSFEGISPS